MGLGVCTICAKSLSISAFFTHGTYGICPKELENSKAPQSTPFDCTFFCISKCVFFHSVTIASKRPCGPPTGNTPGKSQPKLSRSPSQPTSRKSLFNNIGETIEKPCNKKVPWTEQETKTLVQYICLYAEDAWKNKWPSNKDQEFWGKCAEAINKTCSSSRTGMLKVSIFEKVKMFISKGTMSNNINVHY